MGGVRITGLVANFNYPQRTFSSRNPLRFHSSPSLRLVRGDLLFTSKSSPIKLWDDEGGGWPEGDPLTKRVTYGKGRQAPFAFSISGRRGMTTGNELFHLFPSGIPTLRPLCFLPHPNPTEFPIHPASESPRVSL